MRRRAAALLVPLIFLAGCGNSAADPEPTSAAGELPTVTGAFGEKPVIELPNGAPGAELQVAVLEEGDGAVIGDGEVVVADYLGQRWAAAADTESPSADASPAPSEVDNGLGEGVFDSTFDGGTPVSFAMVEGTLLPGMLEGLQGQSIGSRVMVVIPPADGFRDTGAPELGIGADDSIVFVFDLLDVFGADAAADGSAVEQPANPALPSVTASDTGPTITVPSATPPPTELVVQTLIEGAGEEVVSGQYIVVQYRGVPWKDGSEFDASWTRGQPTGFPIGVGGVIAGWDAGLVGKTIGSEVLLVVPPAEGYGEAGSPPTIAGDDTLVFVVDILGAYGDAA